MQDIISNLSTHFSYKESVESGMAIKLDIDNTPSVPIIATMRKTAECMEHVRSLLGNIPISISSWYRSQDLNIAVGSKDTSQHRTGEAVDFICSMFGSPVDIVKTLSISNIQFDQLILEHTWVHISFAILSGKPKRQVLSLVTGGHYVPGITNVHGIPY